ncbi:unnamed protein product [Bursaphelenchus okinawaensis]|uniref:Cytochrome b-c1 complex subunit 8 n=1 Tax=Bursaphelenchus okinawaensis TaxID=465554 RepID=A0A811KB82_9BILA|nr:unnamed protein product [Bursaphelenchus okinawaensis]CAG9096324.1 unnamed protein product [Bursaphelenchus okinawaensis]
MKFSSAVAHKHFGNLGKLYGQYKWSLAPNEQPPMKGWFKAAFVNVFQEYVVRHWYFVVPPFTVAYLTYDWGKRENEKFNRKNPADYANDV